MPTPPLALEDIFADTTAAPKPKKPSAGGASGSSAFDLGSLYDEPSTTTSPLPGMKPGAAPAATPKPGLTVGQLLDQSGPKVERPKVDLGIGVHEDPMDRFAGGMGRFEQRPLAPIDRSTPASQAAAGKAEGARLIAGAAKPDVSGTPGASMVADRAGRVMTESQADVNAGRRIHQDQATEQANFSPEHWKEVAVRGMDLANQLHAEGKHDQAEDVLRKAYNAQLLADSNKHADTFGAIALSNLLGIVGDPYANDRRNMAEIQQPGMTFTPGEQRDMGTRGASTARGTDVMKDYVAPLVGQAPALIAGGAVGRGAAAIAGAGAERLGLETVGKGLARLAAPGEEAAQLGPRVPFSRAGNPGLWRTRVAEEVAQLKANLPHMVKRGATEGQVVGAIQTYSAARDQGASVEDALAAAAEGTGLSIPIGIVAELGLGTIGKAAGVGYDPVGRLTGDLYERARGKVSDMLRPEDRRTAVSGRYAGEQPVGQALPSREAKLAELGDAFQEHAGNAREARAGELHDAFTPKQSTPAGPDFWENLPPEQIPRSEATGREPGPFPRDEAQPQGPLQSAEPQPGRPDRLRSAAEIAMGGEDRPPLQPHEEADAFKQMQRANEDRARYQQALDAEANDPNLKLEQAAQARPGEVQGPRTLTETLEQAGSDAKAGDPMAVEYHDAINTYVDAMAAARDTDAPSTRQRVALARARRALNDMREKYGKQLGASAVLALAANDDDLSEEEKQMVGLGGLAILSTDVVKYGDNHPLMESVGFHSRLKNTVESLPKAWNEPRPAADWVGKLSGSNTLSKKELEILKPFLDSASRNKVKLSRQDVMDLAEAHIPQLERINLAQEHTLNRGEGAAGNSDDIHDIGDIIGEDIPAPHPDYLREQMDNRSAKIEELENQIEQTQEQAASEMHDAESTINMRHRDIRATLDKAGIDTGAMDAAIEHVDENVMEEHYNSRVIDKAMEKVTDELYGNFDQEEMFSDAGYTIKEQTTRNYTVNWTDAEGVAHGEDVILEPGETLDELKAFIKTEYGEEAAKGDLMELPEEVEYVAYNHSNDEVGRGADRDDLIRETVENDGIENEKMGELVSELRGDLENYADARAEYSRAESEHYYATEGDQFADEQSTIDTLRDENRQLEAAIDDATATHEERTRIAAQDEQRRLLEAGGQQNMFGEDTGRPAGEPVAVVPAPEEPERNIIPAVHGKPEYASYQRIGGGTNYREMLTTWANNPGEAYSRGHWSDISNVVGSVRAEDHHVPVTPVSRVVAAGDSELVARLKTRLDDLYTNRDGALKDMNALVRKYEAMSEAEHESPAAHALAREYATLNEVATSFSKHIGEAENSLRSAADDKAPSRTVTVMIENQADWAQSAQKYGIKGEVDEPTKQALADLQQELDRLDAEMPNLNQQWQAATPGSEEEADLDTRRRALQDTRYGVTHQISQLRQSPNAVPPSPFIDAQQSVALNSARFLLDAAERGYGDIAWSDAANRVKNASLPLGAAKLNYDELTPAAMKKLLQSVGVKDPKFDKLYIRGEGHWHFELTPEIRKQIKKVGLPLLGVIAATGLPSQAQAQGEGAQAGGDLYKGLAGGVAAGAALMYLASNRNARRLVKENRELERALMVDDLSGLANKKAFMRALPGVNADDKFHWAVFDGDRFKKLNDTHGHAEGDRAIQHFGKTVMAVAKELDVPMRGFRNGGDEISFAVPAEKAAEFTRMVEERSTYTKGDVTTQLSGAFAPTHEAADVQLNATKAARKAADPSLLREGETVPQPRTLPPASDNGRDNPLGATAYANPIPQAIKELARYPKAAALAGVGALMLDQDNPEIQATGAPVIALAVLSAIGSRRLGAGKDKLATALLDQLRKSPEGTAVARFFNPDALLHPDVLEAIKSYEHDRSRAAARAAEFSGKSKALGPEGDRAVSDVLENEQWEDTSAMSPDQLHAVLTVAAGLDAEYQQAAAEQLATGARTPSQLLQNYAGKRVYAVHEAEAALAEKGGGQQGGSPRISTSKHRTLDEPIRAAEASLAEAQQAGDPTAIQAAQDALGEAKVVQMSRRTELGEIRESSYRAAQSIDKAYSDAAAARLFNNIKNVPGSLHPEWETAATDLATAKAMYASAKTQPDREAAKALLDDAKVRIHKVSETFKREGGEYVSLPTSKGLGMLSGAVVTRDIANSLKGFEKKGAYAKLLRSWKEIKTVWNPGTHQGNILSNIGFSHMEGLPMWEQPLYLKRARADMKEYGPMTRALAEGGIFDVNAVQSESEGVTARDSKSRDGLEELLTTTRPETADRLREHGITEAAQGDRIKRATVKGALAGGAIGAARLYDDESPTDALAGAAVGAGIGALVGKRGGRRVRQLYANEDNLFRGAIWLKKVSEGMTHDQATAYTREALGNFRSRSPALQMARTSIAPFLLYPAKVLPRFASQMVDHPWRYMALLALWGGLNEYSKHQVGDVPESDKAIADRRMGGYFLPGFTQLPFTNKRGDKGAVDVSRWTPLSAATTSAPPGSLPASFDERVPDVFRAGGPAVDLAARFGANVDAFSGKPAYAKDYPVRENIAKLANDVSGTMVPSFADFQLDRLKNDVKNEDFDRAKNDALGTVGLRPRFIRPGSNTINASNTLENSLREMKQAFKRDVMANQNSARTPILRDRYIRRVQQALTNFRERMGLEPDARIVRDALDTK